MGDDCPGCAILWAAEICVVGGGLEVEYKYLETIQDLRQHLNDLSGSDGFGDPGIGLSHEDGLDLVVDHLIHLWSPGMPTSEFNQSIRDLDIWEAVS